MTDVVASTEVEVLVETSTAFTIEVTQDAINVVTESSDGTIEIQDSDPTILVTTSDDTVVSETVSAEVITSAEVETVYAVDQEIVLVEAAEQGPPGPPGPPGAGTSYPGKTVIYTGSLVTEVRLYSDAAKTVLAERRVLAYVGSVLSTIQFFNGAGALTKTRTLTYSGGVLVSVVDT